MTKRSKTPAGDANKTTDSADEALPTGHQPPPEDTAPGAPEPPPPQLEQAPEPALQPDHKHDAQLGEGAQHIADVPQVPVTPEVTAPGPDADFDPNAAAKLLERAPQKTEEQIALERAQRELGGEGGNQQRTLDQAALEQRTRPLESQLDGTPAQELQKNAADYPEELKFREREDAVLYVVRYGQLEHAEVEKLSDGDLMALAREVYAARERAGEINKNPLDGNPLDVPENLKGNAMIPPAPVTPQGGPLPPEDPDPPQWFRVTKGGKFMGESMMVEIKQGAFVNERTHNLRSLTLAGIQLEPSDPPPAYTGL